MTLAVLVVDDEPLARARLKTLLADCTDPPARVAGEAANADQALTLVQAQHFDAVLLDIHMPGISGMALAEQLKALPRPPAIIFVTAHAEYAVGAFELAAVDYLTKPVRLARLQEALQKIELLRQYSRGSEADLADEVVLIQDRGNTERVPLSQVLYFKAELKYLTVRTATHSHILDGALNDLEARFGQRFVRVHRNALVAVRAMRALEKHHDPDEGDGWALRLAGVGELIRVSRRQVAAVREALQG